jgi:hypothetical protein
LEISQYQARRLELPKTAKDALKVAKTVIIEGAFDCLYGALIDKLASIPFLKNYPVLQRAGKAKEELKELILKEMDKFIDGLRRARRNLILRRRTNIFDEVGKGFKKIGEGVVKAGEGVGKGVVKAGEGVGKGVVKAGEGVGKGVVKAGEGVGKGVVKAGEVVGKGVVKAGEGVGKGVVEAAEAVGKVVVSIKDLPKKLEGLIGGALLKALSNIACPVLARIVHHRLDIALKKFGFQQLPMCLHDAILAGCKKGVELAFKRQRILRRLSSLKRELEQF